MAKELIKELAELEKGLDILIKTNQRLLKENKELKDEINNFVNTYIDD